MRRPSRDELAGWNKLGAEQDTVSRLDSLGYLPESVSDDLEGQISPVGYEETEEEANLQEVENLMDDVIELESEAFTKTSPRVGKYSKIVSSISIESQLLNIKQTIQYNSEGGPREYWASNFSVDKLSDILTSLEKLEQINQELSNQHGLPNNGEADEIRNIAEVCYDLIVLYLKNHFDIPVRLSNDIQDVSISDLLDFLDSGTEEEIRALSTYLKWTNDSDRENISVNEELLERELTFEEVDQLCDLTRDSILDLRDDERCLSFFESVDITRLMEEYVNELSEAVERGEVLSEDQVRDLLETTDDLDGDAEYTAYKTVIGHYGNAEYVTPTEILDLFEVVAYAKGNEEPELMESVDEVLEQFDDMNMRDYDIFESDLSVEEIRELYLEELDDMKTRGIDEQGMKKTPEGSKRSITLTTFLLEARDHIAPS